MMADGGFSVEGQENIQVNLKIQTFLQFHLNLFSM